MRAIDREREREREREGERKKEIKERKKERGGRKYLSESKLFPMCIYRILSKEKKLQT